MLIRIKNLRLRTLIGFQPWEREKRQDVVVNLVIHSSAYEAAHSDTVADALDYKTITKRVIGLVEGSRCNLLEHLARRVAASVLEDPRVERVVVEVDKPHALRFADSVSVTLDLTRDS